MAYWMGIGAAGLQIDAQGRLEEFASDPLLTIACVFLIGVSVAWIITARAITRNMRRQMLQAQRRRARGAGRKRAPRR